MDKLISDCAKAEMSNRVKQILRALCISSWYSEPYHENQNFAENRYGTIKAATNRVMNFSGAPAHTWLLALIYVCLLLNHLASAALGWKSPEQILTGQTPDISKFMHFSFYEPVYYHSYSDSFPSVPNEEQGCVVGWYCTSCWRCPDIQNSYQAQQGYLSLCYSIRLGFHQA
jgi:hypothetical protein